MSARTDLTLVDLLLQLVNGATWCRYDARRSRLYVYRGGAVLHVWDTKTGALLDAGWPVPMERVMAVGAATTQLGAVLDRVVAERVSQGH